MCWATTHCHALPYLPAWLPLTALKLRKSRRQIGARHILVESDEISNPEYLANTSNRCFFCKNDTYDKLAAYAQAHGFQAIVDGTNADDAHDYRPGRQAARQHHVRSPLLETGWTKTEIRQAAKEFGLPNWDKPAAACLSSRIPYGDKITLQALSQVERAEALVHSLGLRQLRVRHHESIARIEVEPDDFHACSNTASRLWMDSRPLDTHT